VAELFVYDRKFKPQASFRNRHLKHCHEICRCVRFVGRDGEEKAFRIVSYDEAGIKFAGIDDSTGAWQAFGRGLCPAGKCFLAAGSSPSTIFLNHLETGMTAGFVNLSMDIRNAIHGLEVWPFD
jgi:hypothetical protein